MSELVEQETASYSQCVAIRRCPWSGISPTVISRRCARCSTRMTRRCAPAWRPSRRRIPRESPMPQLSSGRHFGLTQGFPVSVFVQGTQKSRSAWMMRFRTERRSER